ncbi:hypothetical protein K438DRAFT_1976418 [Mycena galopus ATCC 62051]|nr:hypothetical protein K438DRAFT_1976418 [Mycena galopus ATCC 62051]
MNGASQLSSSVACVGKIGPRYHVWAGRVPLDSFGYIWTVLRSVLDSEGLVAEGPEFVEVLRNSDDTVVSAPIRNIELFRPMIMFGDIVSNPYHIGALIRSGLIKALRSLVPEILEEAQLAIPENLKLSDSKDSLSIYLLQQSVVQIAAPSTVHCVLSPAARRQCAASLPIIF